MDARILVYFMGIRSLLHDCILMLAGLSSIGNFQIIYFSFDLNHGYFLILT